MRHAPSCDYRVSKYGGRTLQSRTGPVQGQNRVFLVYFSHTGFPVDGNRFFPVGNTTQGKPYFHYRAGMGLQCTQMIKSIMLDLIVNLEH